MKKTKNNNQEEKLVEQILEKIRTGSVEQEQKEDENQNNQVRTLSAKQLKNLRLQKEKAQKNKSAKKIERPDSKAQEFLENMTDKEEKVFNQMINLINAETEKQKIKGLSLYLKMNKHILPKRLILNLHHFPYLQKYYLLAEAELKNKRKNRC